MEEIKFLEHITSGMWVMFLLGFLAIIGYSLKSEDSEEGTKKYFKLTWKNIAFHLVASLMVFIAIEELGSVLISNYIPALNSSVTYYYTMSALSGMFGSYLVAWVIEKAKSIF